MAVLERTAAARLGPPLALRSFGHWWAVYRRLWRASIATTFLVPLITLVGLGYGLGSLLPADSGFGGSAYLTFLGPGLLATTAMTTAEGESTWPVLGAVRWDKSYRAMLATPLGVTDVLIGHLTWILVRVGISVTAFLVVLLLLGIPDSWTAVLTIPFGVATGFAFAAPLMAFAARTQNESNFSLVYRFVMVPLQLFAGVFFPVSQLPTVLEAVAKVTPIWHGVELCRAATTGTLSWWPAVGHVAYLLLWGAAGIVVARRVYRRVLVV